MLCPKCNGKLTVVDGVYVPDSNEHRRHRVCTQCGHDIYTVEFEVEADKKFKDEWHKHHRVTIRDKARRVRRKTESFD